MSEFVENVREFVANYVTLQGTDEIDFSNMMVIFSGTGIAPKAASPQELQDILTFFMKEHGYEFFHDDFFRRMASTEEQ